MTGLVRICVIKAGSAVLTQPSGDLDLNMIQHLCDQIALLRKSGWAPILVTSGAVAAGRGWLGRYGEARDVEETKVQLLKRVYAALGQTTLLSFYKEFLERQNPPLHVAQVLLTREAFADRSRYGNLQNTFREMLLHHVLPIVNANDVVHLPLKDFADNDALAAHVAAMVGAEMLVLLSDVDGLFSRNPKLHSDATKIDDLTAGLDEKAEIDDSMMSAGGMTGKLKALRWVGTFGISCCIANGKKANTLSEILINGNEQRLGTTLRVEPPRRNTDTFARWLVAGASPIGTIIVSTFGADALQREEHLRGSLLAAGVERVCGVFQQDDAVAIRNENGVLLGIGKSKFSSLQLRRDIERAKDTIVIHRDNFRPFTLSESFVNERSSVSDSVKKSAKRWFVKESKAGGYIEVGAKNPETPAMIARFEEAQGILVRAAHAEREMGLKRTDWILYEMVSGLQEHVARSSLPDDE